MLAIHTPKKFWFIIFCLKQYIEHILKPILQVYGNEVKLAVTGMAAYDYDPRLCRSFPKAGPVTKL